MRAVAEEQRGRHRLWPPHRPAAHPVTDHRPGRRAGEGTIGQVAGDLEQLRRLGADTVVLDPFSGDPRETYHPEMAWRALATVPACWDQNSPHTRTEQP
jgi:hypothetical protein